MNITTIDHVCRLINEKRNLKGKPGYQEMKERVDAIRRQTTPFNSVMATNDQWKREGKSDRKQAKRDLQAKLIAEAKPHEATLQILAKINCVHGTNSAVLALAPIELLPTGVLLDRGMAPMSGEISLGGTDRYGVNQQNISMYTTSHYQGSLRYAKNISHSFHPPESFEVAFLRYLNQLEKVTTESNAWDEIMIHFYQLKQWDPPTFQNLTEKYRQRVDQAGTGKTQEDKLLDALDYDINHLELALSNEAIRTEVEQELNLKGTPWTTPSESYQSLSYVLNISGSLKVDFEYFMVNPFYVIQLRLFGDQEVECLYRDTSGVFAPHIRKAFEEKTGNSRDVAKLLDHTIRAQAAERKNLIRLFHERRQERKRKLFSNPPKVHLTDREKKFLTSPFPLLIASSVVRPIIFRCKGAVEYIAPSLKWGEEIDHVFVPQQNIPTMQTWLAEKSLTRKVHVTALEALEQLPEVFFPPINRSLYRDDPQTSFTAEQLEKMAMSPLETLSHHALENLGQDNLKAKLLQELEQFKQLTSSSPEIQSLPYPLLLQVLECAKRHFHLFHTLHFYTFKPCFNLSYKLTPSIENTIRTFASSL